MSSELDEFLSRAVDRQIAEQRALREALHDLRTAVDSLGARPVEAAFDQGALDERVMHVASEVREATRSEITALRRDLAELRALVSSAAVQQRPDDTLRHRFDELADAIHATKDLDVLRDEVASVNANIEGIAAALIDLNAGLREWANGVDEGLTALVRSVGSVRRVAGEARDAATAANASLQLEVEVGGEDDDLAIDTVLDERVEQIEARIDETAQLAMNLRAQIDDFERTASGMQELPKAIEGTVAQALRRAMAARAKLDRDAEAAMDETLGAVDEHLDALNEAIANIGSSDDEIRKIALGQVDLTSQLDSMQDAFLSRLEALEDNNREAQAALARAIDRSAAGRDPRAAETVGNPARRASTPKEPTRRKPTAQRKRRPPRQIAEDSEQ